MVPELRTLSPDKEHIVILTNVGLLLMCDVDVFALLKFKV